ncbi:MAG: SpoVA/SpoVAEb family sporulation membrane protein [Ruminococcus sp.]|nr:SpoVA/SpoVAEb family sporulation membrane protein [Ruminococcus sp.]
MVNVSKSQYEQMYKKASKNSNTPLNVIKAFCIGGAICALGQGIKNIYLYLGLSNDNASAAVSITLILLSAVLTALGIYEKIAKHGGAGTLVPITGFANSVVAPAIEFRTEGLVTGLGAKIFTVCGPVILYSTLAGFVYGIIYMFIK